MEGNQKDDDGENVNQQKEQDKVGIPDLEMTMQAMSLVEPGLCRVQSSQVIQQTELDFSFCLIMKVACTGGTPRSISQQALEQAMARAWRDRFFAISQVSNTVFMAHFRSQEDMISVYTRQPWVANSENLLVDWFDPNDNANSSSDYTFDQILVTVRAYGIPRNRRSISLLTNILNQVGAVSEFHILQESNLFAKQDYIWGTARLSVNTPVKDRAIVAYADNTTGLAYLNYEKIKRICLFCGIMFHNVQNCSIRNSLISERYKNRQSGFDIPAQRFGHWVVDEKFIPVEVIQSTRMGDQGNNQGGNAILSRLQRLFAENPKEKGKIVETVEERITKRNTNVQERFNSQYQAVNICQSSILMQNRLHNAHVAVHPPFGQRDGDLASDSMLGRQLAVSQTTNQHLQQGFTPPIRGSEVMPNTREEVAIQEHTGVLQNTTTGREIPSTIQGLSLLPTETPHILPGQHLGNQNIATLQTQSEAHYTPGTQEKHHIVSSSTLHTLCQHDYTPPPLQQQNTNQIQRPTTTPPLQIAMDSPMQVPSNSLPATHQSSLMQKHSPKRPLPSPSPNPPPLAKKASHLDPDGTTQAGILGAGPAGRGATRSGGEGEEGSRGGDPFDTILGADSSVADCRARRRPSGWDIQDNSQIGPHDASTVGVTVYHHGSATWQRFGAANEMGQGGPHRRSRGTSLGRIVHPYAASPCRSPTRATSATSTDHDPRPFRQPSPTCSVGTHDSRASFEDSQAVGKQNHQRDNTGTSMEFDMEAMAPASKAPRAP